jgi:hypothetical protein
MKPRHRNGDAVGIMEFGFNARARRRLAPTLQLYRLAPTLQLIFA